MCLILSQARGESYLIFFTYWPPSRFDLQIFSIISKENANDTGKTFLTTRLFL